MDNKGLTLVELLAVIVVLAILAVIAVSIIFGIIETSRENAFKSGMHGIREAIRTNSAENNFIRSIHYEYGPYPDVRPTPSTECPIVDAASGRRYESIENGEYILVRNGPCAPIAMKGAVRGSGRAYIDSQGEVFLAIFDGSRCGAFGRTKKDNAGNDVVDWSIYTSTDYNRSQCMALITHWPPLP